MSRVTGWLIDSAMGKMADEMLAREQFHIRVNGETGRVTVYLGFCEYSWRDFPAYFTDPISIPPYGRVWIHVE